MTSLNAQAWRGIEGVGGRESQIAYLARPSI
jgi:hypothetical protein